MPKYLSSSENDTKEIAAELGRSSKTRTIALTGELGAGKTVFVQGFAKGLGIKDKIISPTFVLIRQHQIPNCSKILYHIDLYRLENIEDILHLGIEEILSSPTSIVVIEWAEKIKSLLPKATVEVSFQVMEDGTREINLSNN